MAIDTVTLTADGVWQDGTPFDGYLEVTLQETGNASDGIVAPKKAQEIYFSEGRAEVPLVPSSAIGGAKYRLRVMTSNISGNYKSKTCLLDELVEVPERDCGLHELVKKSAASEQEPEAEDVPAGE